MRIRVTLSVLTALALALPGGCQRTSKEQAEPAAAPPPPAPQPAPELAPSPPVAEPESVAAAAPADAAPAKSPPGTAMLMTGPHASPAAYCKEVIEKSGNTDDPYYCVQLEDLDEDVLQDFALDKSMLAVHKPGAPFIEAQFIGIDPTFMDCRLAVRTAAGWFVASKSLYCASSDNRSRSQVILDKLELSGGMLVLRLTSTDSGSNMDNDGLHSESESKEIMICGIGPSKRPSCIEPIVFAYSSLEEPIDPKSGGSKKSSSSAGSAAIDGNQLVIADEDPPANGKKKPPRRIPLVFP